MKFSERANTNFKHLYFQDRGSKIFEDIRKLFDFDTQNIKIILANFDEFDDNFGQACVLARPNIFDKFVLSKRRESVKIKMGAYKTDNLTVNTVA